MADNETAVSCSCAAMKIFSAPLNKDDLKKSTAVVLPRDLPINPKEAASKINGMRDNSLTEAQTATINVSLTKQKMENLPDVVKSRPAVQQMSSKLTATQTNLVTQTAQVHSLGKQLTDVETKRDVLLAEKSSLEEEAKTQVSVSSNLKSQALKTATDLPEYKSFEGYRTGVETLSVSSEAAQKELTQSAQYQSVLNDLSVMDKKHEQLLTQYTSARDSLNNLSGTVKGQLPEISKNLDILQEQYNALQLTPSKLMAQPLPAMPKLPTDTVSILNVAINMLDSNGKLSSMLQEAQRALPGLPSSSGMPSMPALPSMPSFPQPTLKDGIEYFKLPPGLLATPSIPAMPAYPGTDALPAMPETFIDKSIETAMDSSGADAKVLSQAQAYASTVNINDVQSYFTSNAKSRADAAKSALKQTANGYLTRAMNAMPAISARPALPPFPATADLTKFAGIEVPTLPSLQKNMDKISPDKLPFYNAIWTEIAAKQAARSRILSAVKESTASAHTATMQLVDAQKKAALEGVSVGQYLQKQSGTNPIFNALAEQRPPSLTGKFSAIPETPLQCTKQCNNLRIRNLFPDVASPAQMKVARLFADADKLVSTPAVHMISVGESSDAFVQGHITNLQNRVREAGGKTVTIFPEDIKDAVANPADMLKLEKNLQDTSMVSMPNVSNLSPQEAILANKIATDMSASVPVIMTTPSIRSLAVAKDGAPESLEGARKINTALIGQLVPGGSVDARAPAEVPQTTIYDNPIDNAQTSSEFKGIFSKYT